MTGSASAIVHQPRRPKASLLSRADVKREAARMSAAGTRMTIKQVKGTRLDTFTVGPVTLALEAFAKAHGLKKREAGALLIAKALGIPESEALPPAAGGNPEETRATPAGCAGNQDDSRAKPAAIQGEDSMSG